MNIGPKGDGSIPEGDKKILQDLGSWMCTNREAIDGAKVWRKSQEGPTRVPEGQFQDQQETCFTAADYRFTTANGAIYAIAMQCPQDGHFLIRSLADSQDQNQPDFHGILSDVSILGFENADIRWKKDREGLHVYAPNVYSQFPIVLKLMVE